MAYDQQCFGGYEYVYKTHKHFSMDMFVLGEVMFFQVAIRRTESRFTCSCICRWITLAFSSFQPVKAFSRSTRNMSKSIKTIPWLCSMYCHRNRWGIEKKLKMPVSERASPFFSISPRFGWRSLPEFIQHVTWYKIGHETFNIDIQHPNILKDPVTFLRKPINLSLSINNIDVIIMRIYGHPPNAPNPPPKEIRPYSGIINYHGPWSLNN